MLLTSINHCSILIKLLILDRHLDTDGSGKEDNGIMTTNDIADIFDTNETNDTFGTIAVVDGRFVTTNPAGQGKPAVIIPAAGVNVSVNGKLITGATAVYSPDFIEVQRSEYDIPPAILVNISNDNMTAAVTLTPRRCTRQIVEDNPPTSELRIKLIEERKEEWLYGFDDVMAALQKKRIKIGIDRDALAAAVRARDEQEYVVARGIPVEEGKNGIVEMFFHPGPIIVAPSSDEEHVDHRERIKLPLVHEGDLLAKIHKPVPGKPGQKVTGELILPKQVKEATFRIGEGAQLSEDCTQVSATVSGRPMMEGDDLNMVLWVSKVLEHGGDVNLSSGNLRFDGEVVIYGNVEPGMVITATGNAMIRGSVDRAIIEGGKGVTVSGSVIWSKIRAGGSGPALFVQGLMPDLEQTAADFDRLLAACTQLAVQNNSKMDDILYKRPGQLIMTLFSNNFADMHNRLDKLTALLNSGGQELPTDLAGWLSLCRGKLIGLSPTNLSSIDEVKEIRQKLTSVISVLAVHALVPRSIIVPYLQNSILEASGDININGAGCFHSIIGAGGGVTIARAFRSGQIRAKGNVCIAQAGSPNARGASSCVIAVDKTACAEFLKVEPDVVVQVGHQRYRFEKEMSMVRVRLNGKGEIELARYH